MSPLNTKESWSFWSKNKWNLIHFPITKFKIMGKKVLNCFAFIAHQQKIIYYFSYLKQNILSLNMYLVLFSVNLFNIHIFPSQSDYN